MQGNLKIGISAWTEKTLIESGWYPPGTRDAESRLRYYATQFPIVEVDATYYALPARHQVEVWDERTPPGFTMNVKAHALFTGHYTDARRLPRDLRDELPPALRTKARLYPKDIPGELFEELTRRFRDALDPLVQSGKLGLVLLQYPVWFTRSPEHRRALATAQERLPGCRVAVEFRNRYWMSERHRDETLALLRAFGLAYTAVDEPQGFASSVPPVAEATADVALVRFHGRNVRTWDRPMPSAAARMSYEYTPAELREWVPRLQRLAASAPEVHVIMNNCHRDYAVKNATQMMALVDAAHLPVTHALAEAAPLL